jgi:hypothetical protein
MAALFEKYLDEKQYPSYRLKNKVRLTIATTLARGRAKNILKTEAPFFETARRHNGEILNDGRADLRVSSEIGCRVYDRNRQFFATIRIVSNG